MRLFCTSWVYLLWWGGETSAASSSLRSARKSEIAMAGLSTGHILRGLATSLPPPIWFALLPALVPPAAAASAPARPLLPPPPPPPKPPPPPPWPEGWAVPQAAS